jgi:tetratricopeptide (TPR) repeat protein
MRRVAPQVVVWVAILLSSCDVASREDQVKRSSETQQPAVTEPVAETGPSSNVVYLDQSRRWTLSSTGWGDGRPLAREIARQAFLIAARDELGLTTRDAWLGASMPTEGDNSPWEFTAAPGSPVHVKLVHGFPARPREYCDQALPKDVCNQHAISYEKLAGLEEKASRGEYVEALKKAGFRGQRHKQDASLTVPDSIEGLLGQMDFLAQYRAVRELHEILRSQGESPALLGALARGYAQLGVLTEYYWHPAHKVFKARGLLYAERAMAQSADAPLARWNRAFALALMGDPIHAEKESDKAEKAWEALPEADRPEKPAWAALIKPFCRYEIDALKKLAEEPGVKELATLLRFVAVEEAGGETWAVETATESLDVVPRCYRIHDSLCQFGGVATLHSATMAPVAIAGRSIYDQIRTMPGLPSEALAVATEGPNDGADSQEPEGADPDDWAEEFKHRRRLMDALLKTGQGVEALEGENVEDAGEPAWDTLGLLLRELSFIQVVRRGLFEAQKLAVPLDDWLSDSAPLVENHPYRDYLLTLPRDRAARQEITGRLIKADLVGLEFAAYPIYQVCVYFQNSDGVRAEMIRNLDYTPRDFTVLIRCYPYVSDPVSQNWQGETLLVLNPRSPMARTLLLQTNWAGVPAKLPEWDRDAVHFPALASQLAEYYLAAGRLEEAARAAKAALDLMPTDLAARRRLAAVYSRQGDEDRAIATLEEQLRQPDYNLDHASVQSEIAHYYMAKKEWEKALPYAEGAAGSYSAWGLQCAAVCHEALQQWTEAEALYRAHAERYEDPVDWYFFCRRTGEGDLVTARQACQAVEKTNANTGRIRTYDLVLYDLLEDAPEKAIPELEKALADDRSAEDAVWLALIADQLQDASKRDAALRQAVVLATEQAKKQAETKNANAQSNPDAVLRLVEALTKDLAAGGKGQLDLEALDKLATEWKGACRFSFEYALAQYLHLHGRSDAAVNYWKRCMGYPGIDARYRTLAGAALLERGIKPADYRPLLLPEAKDTEGKKPEAQEDKAL